MGSFSAYSHIIDGFCTCVQTEGDGRHVDDLLCTRHQAEVTLLKPSSAKTYAMVQPDHGCAYYLFLKQMRFIIT